MNKEFQRQLKEIALPVTVQSLMQSSLSLIDQIMIGSLGSDCIAGVGLAGKFTSLYSVTLTAIVSVAGILIAQYRGAKDERCKRQLFSTILLCHAPDGIFFCSLPDRTKSHNGFVFR